MSNDIYAGPDYAELLLPVGTEYVLVDNGTNTKKLKLCNLTRVINVTGSNPISVATGTTTSTISISAASTAVDGYLSYTDWNTFNGKQPAGSYELTTNKGSANGYCPLDSGSKVSATYLPSYVDDVLESANYAAFPGTGETGKIYVTLDTNLTYRWSGTAYVQIDATIGLGETSATAYRGDRGKTAYDHSSATGNPHGASTADIADSVNKRYCTDAQKTVISNTSGTNTGDQTNISGSSASCTGNAATATSAAYAATAGTVTGAITGLKETAASVAASALDLATANVFYKTISGVTTFTLSNVAATGTVSEFILELTNGGAFAVTWWSGIKWVAGTAPTLTAAGLDTIFFYTRDGGTTWRGYVAKGMA